MITAAKSSCLILLVLVLSLNLNADEFDHEPIHYSSAKAVNPISRLQERWDHGKPEREFDSRFGYLPAILKELDIPVESQTLVYSKTSLQRDRISPRTPRALYFNDDVYVGYCQDGDVLEISTADATLGTVFYTLSQEPSDSPRFVRQTDHCLSCHAAAITRGIPGHLLRSVYVDRNGFPLLSLGSHRIDQTVPFNQRWGGWYVTGLHGSQSHLGNLILPSTTQRAPVENPHGQNITSLEKRFDTSRYLAPHSDLIALLVLEHQTEAHNLITRANFQTREAHFSETRLNKELGEPEGHRWDSTNTRIRGACEALVKYLLFSDEPQLTEPVEGTSGFANVFNLLGKKDSRGRSLRDLELKSRVFRYPCSYLIYSESFDALPDEAREHVYRRLWQVLTGQDQSKPFAHLSTEDRQAILEILRETKGGLPAYWFEVVPDEANDR